MAYVNTLQVVEIETDKGVIKAIGGSYDGFGYYVASTTYSDGKEIITHKIVDAEFPVHQDMGRLPRILTQEIYIIGANALPRRDKLIKRLVARGEKEIVDPYFGIMRGRAGAFTNTNNATTLNVCSLNVTFAIGSQAAEIVFIPDTSKAIKQQAASMIDNLIAVYAKSMKFIDSGKSYLRKVQAGVNTANGAIVAARDTVRSIAEYQSLAAGILQNINSTILNGQAFVRDTIALVTFTNNQSVGLKNAWYTLLDAEYSVSVANTDADNIYNPTGIDTLDESLRLSAIEVDSELPDYLPDTVNKETYLESMGAFNKVIKVAAITNLAQAVTEVEFTSLEQLAFYTEAVNSTFWDLLVLVQDDQVIYNNVQVLQATTLLNLDETALALPTIEVVTLPVGGPVLSVVGSYYSNPVDAEEVISLNGIKHPGFIPAGTVLEIKR